MSHKKAQKEVADRDSEIKLLVTSFNFAIFVLFCGYKKYGGNSNRVDR